VVTLDGIRDRLRDQPADAEIRHGNAGPVRDLSYRGPGGSRIDALLVEPAGEAGAAVLLVHPASGDRTSLLPDAVDLAGHGVRCLLPQLAREQDGDVQAVVASRAGWIETLCLGLAALRACHPVPLPVGYLGQNLGGALAGAVTAIDGGVAAAVAVAPLPDMGGFFVSSPHPAAASRRARLGLPAMRAVRDATAGLELLVTIGADPGTRWLLQLGGHDDWSPARDAAPLYKLKVPDADIEVYPDAGHGLATPGARADRVQWLRTRLGLSRERL
jgi:dienelactone hydrolase